MGATGCPCSEKIRVGGGSGEGRFVAPHRPVRTGSELGNLSSGFTRTLYNPVGLKIKPSGFNFEGGLNLLRGSFSTPCGLAWVVFTALGLVGTQRNIGRGVV